MYRSIYTVQADDCARRALSASTDIDREVLLATERTLRQFADADERIERVRERHPSVFASRTRAGRAQRA